MTIWSVSTRKSIHVNNFTQVPRGSTCLDSNCVARSFGVTAKFIFRYRSKINRIPSAEHLWRHSSLDTRIAVRMHRKVIVLSSIQLNVKSIGFVFASHQRWSPRRFAKSFNGASISQRNHILEWISSLLLKGFSLFFVIGFRFRVANQLPMMTSVKLIGSFPALKSLCGAYT